MEGGVDAGGHGSKLGKFFGRNKQAPTPQATEPSRAQVLEAHKQLRQDVLQEDLRGKLARLQQTKVGDPSVTGRPEPSPFETQVQTPQPETAPVSSPVEQLASVSLEPVNVQTEPTIVTPVEKPLVQPIESPKVQPQGDAAIASAMDVLFDDNVRGGEMNADGSFAVKKSLTPEPVAQAAEPTSISEHPAFRTKLQDLKTEKAFPDMPKNISSLPVQPQSPVDYGAPPASVQPAERPAPKRGLFGKAATVASRLLRRAA